MNIAFPVYNSIHIGAAIMQLVASWADICEQPHSESPQSVDPKCFQGEEIKKLCIHVCIQ